MAGVRLLKRSEAMGYNGTCIRAETVRNIGDEQGVT